MLRSSPSPGAATAGPDAKKPAPAIAIAAHELLPIVELILEPRACSIPQPPAAPRARSVPVRYVRVAVAFSIEHLRSRERSRGSRDPPPFLRRRDDCAVTGSYRVESHLVSARIRRRWRAVGATSAALSFIV